MSKTNDQLPNPEPCFWHTLFCTGCFLYWMYFVLNVFCTECFLYWMFLDRTFLKQIFLKRIFLKQISKYRVRPTNLRWATTQPISRKFCSTLPSIQGIWTGWPSLHCNSWDLPWIDAWKKSSQKSSETLLWNAMWKACAFRPWPGQCWMPRSCQRAVMTM